MIPFAVFFKVSCNFRYHFNQIFFISICSFSFPSKKNPAYHSKRNVSISFSQNIQIFRISEFPFYTKRSKDLPFSLFLGGCKIHSLAKQIKDSVIFQMC